jgi:hypothetical protein
VGVSDSHTEILWNWLTDPVPDKPQELLNRALQARAAFATECIEQLTVPINAYLRCDRPATLHGKQCIVEQLRGILDPLGLGIRCGEAVGRITARSTGENGCGRYVVLGQDDIGRPVTLATMTHLTRVELGMLRAGR